MESSKNATKVGLFVFVSLAIIAALILNFSKGVSWFTSGYTIIIKSRNVGGLKPGAPVVISGVTIGSVKGVSLAADNHSVLIECRIQKQFPIHADAIVEIEQSGFLGDQYVSIVPGDDKGAPVADGVMLAAREPFNLQEAARSAVGLMSRLETAVDKINGAVARVDKTLLSESALGDITNMIGNLRRTSERAERAIGNIEAAVTNATPGATEAITNLVVFSHNLNTLTTNAQAMLSANQDNIQASLANLKSTTENVKQISGELQQGKGLLGAVLKDDGLHTEVEGILKNFGVLSSNLSRNGIFWKPKEPVRYTNAPRMSPRGQFN
ncbi:MAG TPA: MlaD family protein [Candidatus Limnocylindria bacterium]|jgi:phospholipid/cholesterol/gamma-HCH transport system substrate-binding protein|nr:MlaD family protein [Candidatus Limnocylindria bacterium]